jgi:hypothetical protein
MAGQSKRKRIRAARLAEEEARVEAEEAHPDYANSGPGGITDMDLEMNERIDWILDEELRASLPPVDEEAVARELAKIYEITRAYWFAEMAVRSGDAALIHAAAVNAVASYSPAMDETAHLLRVPANAKRLRDSIASAERGETIPDWAVREA